MLVNNNAFRVATTSDGCSNPLVDSFSIVAKYIACSSDCRSWRECGALKLAACGARLCGRYSECEPAGREEDSHALGKLAISSHCFRVLKREVAITGNHVASKSRPRDRLVSLTWIAPSPRTSPCPPSVSFEWCSPPLAAPLCCSQKITQAPLCNIERVREVGIAGKAKMQR